jgi:hypothetical protein
MDDGPHAPAPNMIPDQPICCRAFRSDLAAPHDTAWHLNMQPRPALCQAGLHCTLAHCQIHDVPVQLAQRFVAFSSFPLRGTNILTMQIISSYP